MKRALSYLLLGVLISILFFTVTNVNRFGDHPIGVGEHYLKEGVKEAGATNLVTNIVLDYRGYDTLGEVTVLFTATTGVAALFWMQRRENDGEE
ncbi:MAG: hydrogen gas-evolving membrane-bound hydrogenase subunit E [Candidatus Methanofastidiosia archaeon]